VDRKLKDVPLTSLARRELNWQLTCCAKVEVNTLFDLCPFEPHPNFDPAMNQAICESELEGGVHLHDLPVGAVIEVETENHLYCLENRGDGQVLISGHPRFCAEPVLVTLQGSNWGTPMLKWRFIGRGMRMELIHPQLGVIITSPVREIHERKIVTSRKIESGRDYVTDRVAT